MEFLFFFFALAYLFVNFSILFLERPTKIWRVLLLMFFGAFVCAFENIKLALRY